MYSQNFKRQLSSARYSGGFLSVILRRHMGPLMVHLNFHLTMSFGNSSHQ